MKNSAPAGWYPDPDGSGQPRWWTGEHWLAVGKSPMAAAKGVTLKGPADFRDENLAPEDALVLDSLTRRKNLPRRIVGAGVLAVTLVVSIVFLWPDAAPSRPSVAYQKFCESVQSYANANRVLIVQNPTLSDDGLFLRIGEIAMARSIDISSITAVDAAKKAAALAPNPVLRQGLTGSLDALYRLNYIAHKYELQIATTNKWVQAEQMRMIEKKYGAPMYAALRARANDPTTANTRNALLNACPSATWNAS